MSLTVLLSVLIDGMQLSTFTQILYLRNVFMYLYLSISCFCYLILRLYYIYMITLVTDYMLQLLLLPLQLILHPLTVGIFPLCVVLQAASPSSPRSSTCCWESSESWSTCPAHTQVTHTQVTHTQVTHTQVTHTHR